MIEAGFQYGRRPAIVLRGAEDDNRIRHVCLIANGKIPNLPIERNGVDGSRREQHKQNQRSPFEDSPNHATCLRTPPLRNSWRSSNEIGPSLRITGGSVVKSRRVDPPEDVNNPPSTIASMDSPSCAWTS